jgi:nitroreductase
MDEKGRDLLLAKERYSVRKYKSDMIGDDELNRILDAGMLAPTECLSG